MQILSKRSTRVVMGLALLTFVALMAATTVSAARSATTVTIWVDADRKPAVDKVAAAWGASRGVTVNVVQKQFGDIRTDLSKVQADSAPDVIVGAHDWTGELAANGLLLPLSPRKAIRDKFPSYTLDAFSYGTAVKRLYGAPVAVENIGLIINTKLAKVPDDVRGAAEVGSRVQGQEEGQPRHRRPAGRERRRVPHVPVLLGSLRLRVRQEQGRQPRPVRHRPREREVPRRTRSRSTAGTRSA